MQQNRCSSSSTPSSAVPWQCRKSTLDSARQLVLCAADDMPSYAKVERWQDRQAGSTKTGTLQQAMTLDPTYFPEELYSAKDKRWDGLTVCHPFSACFRLLTQPLAVGPTRPAAIAVMRELPGALSTQQLHPLQDIGQGGFATGAACLLGGLRARQHRRRRRQCVPPRC
jgi:hypothetical protein